MKQILAVIFAFAMCITMVALSSCTEGRDNCAQTDSISEKAENTEESVAGTETVAV